MNYMIREAKDSDLNYISRMHITTEEPVDKWFNFYFDKTKFYYDCDSCVILVAEEKNIITGFIIFTFSRKKIKINCIKKFYWLKWILYFISGRYGCSKKMILKLVKIPVIILNSLNSKNKNSLDNAESKIIAVVVNPQFQGKGIATELLSRAIEECRQKGIKKICITVNIENNKAINLYKKIGFIEKKVCLESTGDSLYLVKEIN